MTAHSCPAQTSNSGRIGFAGLLTVIFVVLKLTDNIDWAWWWVLSPILIQWGALGCWLFWRKATRWSPR